MSLQNLISDNSNFDEKIFCLLCQFTSFWICAGISKRQNKEIKEIILNFNIYLTNHDLSCVKQFFQIPRIANSDSEGSSLISKGCISIGCSVIGCISKGSFLIKYWGFVLILTIFGGRFWDGNAFAFNFPVWRKSFFLKCRKQILGCLNPSSPHLFSKIPPLYSTEKLYT